LAMCGRTQTSSLPPKKQPNAYKVYREAGDCIVDN
jgi:hypothetical protein